jgi:hypothetical protein
VQLGALGNMDHVRLCVRIMKQFGSLAHRALFLFGVSASHPGLLGIASVHSDEVKEEGPADLPRSIYSKAKNRFWDLHCLHHDGLHRAVLLICKAGLP